MASPTLPLESPPAVPNRSTRRHLVARAYLGIPDAATYLDLTPKTVRRLIASGELPRLPHRRQAHQGPDLRPRRAREADPRRCRLMRGGRADRPPSGAPPDDCPGATTSTNASALTTSRGRRRQLIAKYWHVACLDRACVNCGCGRSRELREEAADDFDLIS